MKENNKNNGDIFSDDKAFKEWELKKAEEDRQKRVRIDKVLDSYCWNYFNSPAAEYRSQYTDLIYRPKQYPLNVVHPMKDAYTAQFVGFNQNSGSALYQRQKQITQQAPLPQQFYYPQVPYQQQSPLAYMGQQSLSQSQLGMPQMSQMSQMSQMPQIQQMPQMPQIPMPQMTQMNQMPQIPGLQSQLMPTQIGGNVFYDVEQFAHPMFAQNDQVDVHQIGNGRVDNYLRKNELMHRSNQIQSNLDRAMKKLLMDDFV